MPMKRRLFVVFLALLLAVWFAQPPRSYASAVLVRAEPPDGATLAQPPQRMQLWLSESALIDPAEIMLIDASGQMLTPTAVRTETYQPKDAKLDDQFDPTYLYLCSVGLQRLPTVLTIDLPALDAGVYQLSWRSIATGTRHTASGTLSFRVGAGAAAPAEAETVASRTAQIADLLATVSIKPNLPGQNFLNVRVSNTRRPAPPITAAVARLSPPDGSAPLTLPAEPLGNGGFRINGATLAQAGTWNIELVISREGVADVVVPLTWDLPAPASRLSPALPLMAVLVCGGLVAFGMIAIRRRRGKLVSA